MASTAYSQQAIFNEEPLACRPWFRSLVSEDEDNYQRLPDYTIAPSLSDTLLNSAPPTPSFDFGPRFDTPGVGQSDCFNIEPPLSAVDPTSFDMGNTIDSSSPFGGGYQSSYGASNNPMQFTDPFVATPVPARKRRSASIARPIVMKQNFPSYLARNQGSPEYNTGLAAAHIGDAQRKYQSGYSAMLQYVASQQGFSNPQTPNQGQSSTDFYSNSAVPDPMKYQRVPKYFPPPGNGFGGLQNDQLNKLFLANERFPSNQHQNLGGQNLSISPQSPFPNALKRTHSYTCTPNAASPSPTNYVNPLDMHSRTLSNRTQSYSEGQGPHQAGSTWQHQSMFFNPNTYTGDYVDLLNINGRDFTREEGCLVVALQRDMRLDGDTVAGMSSIH